MNLQFLVHFGQDLIGTMELNKLDVPNMYTFSDQCQQFIAFGYLFQFFILLSMSWWNVHKCIYDFLSNNFDLSPKLGDPLTLADCTAL